MEEDGQRENKQIMDRMSEEKKQNMQHQQKSERQDFSKIDSLKMVFQMLKTKLCLWNIGKELGRTRKCIKCEEPELGEHILHCNKVLECAMKESRTNICCKIYYIRGSA